jgi:aldose 1-epimerase
MAFRVSTRQQPTASVNGTIHVLEGDDDRAEVWPALGFNCFQWQVRRGGRTLDLLYADPQLFDNGRPTRSGIPVLFPFPNRIRAGRFDWAERTYRLPLNDGTKQNAIHGFACRRPWRVVEEGADSGGAWITGAFQFSVDDPESAALWPADGVLRLTVRLSPGRLRLEAEVYNPDRLPLPFGLGYHPYFNVPFVPGASADDCLIEVPARSYWVLEDSLPTGNTPAVDAARDFTRPRRYGDVKVDDVLTDIESTRANGLRYNGSLRQDDIELRMASSPCFRELVVFTPPHRQAFCLEPYTCPTDAVNLDGDVGWLVLPSGERWTAVVELTV